MSAAPRNRDYVVKAPAQRVGPLEGEVDRETAASTRVPVPGDQLRDRNANAIARPQQTGSPQMVIVPTTIAPRSATLPAIQPRLPFQVRLPAVQLRRQKRLELSRAPLKGTRSPEHRATLVQSVRRLLAELRAETNPTLNATHGTSVWRGSTPDAKRLPRPRVVRNRVSAQCNPWRTVAPATSPLNPSNIRHVDSNPVGHAPGQLALSRGFSHPIEHPFASFEHLSVFAEEIEHLGSDGPLGEVPGGRKAA